MAAAARGGDAALHRALGTNATSSWFTRSHGRAEDGASMSPDPRRGCCAATEEQFLRSAPGRRRRPCGPARRRAFRRSGRAGRRHCCLEQSRVLRRRATKTAAWVSGSSLLYRLPPPYGGYPAATRFGRGCGGGFEPYSPLPHPVGRGLPASARGDLSFVAMILIAQGSADVRADGQQPGPFVAHAPRDHARIKAYPLISDFLKLDASAVAFFDTKMVVATSCSTSATNRIQTAFTSRLAAPASP